MRKESWIIFIFLALAVLGNSAVGAQSWQEISSIHLGLTVQYPTEGWVAELQSQELSADEGALQESVRFSSESGALITLDAWRETSGIPISEWIEQHRAMLGLEGDPVMTVRPSGEEVGDSIHYRIDSMGAQICDTQEVFFRHKESVYRFSYYEHDLGFSNAVFQHLLNSVSFGKTADRVFTLGDGSAGDDGRYVSCGGHAHNAGNCGFSNPYPCCSNDGNCTWWAWNRACVVWDDALPGPWRHAKYWASIYSGWGYTVSSVPMVQSIACRDVGNWGHVAWVTDVVGDTVYVSEMNCDYGPGGVHHNVPYNISYFNAGFIYPLGTGYGKISSGVNISPLPVVLGQSTNINFTLKEVDGEPVHFEHVSIDLRRAGGEFLTTIHVWNDINLTPNGTRTLSRNYTVPVSYGPGGYKVIIRGSVDGDNFFDFTTTVDGTNYQPFYAVNSTGGSGWAAVSQLMVPSHVYFDEYFPITFSLKEIWGGAVTLNKVYVDILDENFNLLFNFATYSNVQIPSGGTWTRTPTGSIWTGTEPQILWAMLRGQASAGGQTFDFVHTGSAFNPEGFVVSDGSGAPSDGYLWVTEGVTVNPATVAVGQPFNVSFGLQEMHGSPASLDEIRVVILDQNDNWVANLPSYSNVDIAAGGSWDYSENGMIPPGSDVGNYKAVARGRGGSSGNWFDFVFRDGGENPQPFVAEITLPVQPTNLSATPNSSSRVDLSWDDNSFNEDGFRIMRDGMFLSELAADQTSFSDTGLDAGTQYSYRVLAFNVTGESAQSNQDCATTVVAVAITAELNCVPAVGNLPFSTTMAVRLGHDYGQQTRRLAGRIDFETASGNGYTNWRAGFTQVSPGEEYAASWNQQIPALPSLLGINRFQLVVEDVTPIPFNQPPYPPAGVVGSDLCTVEGLMP